MRMYALAASVLLAVVLGAAIYWMAPSGRVYETEVGGISTVPMADGSKVTLNTDSKVRVAVTVKERHVELAQGEAFFEVAHDGSRPFVVQAGKKRVIAVGTKFSVRRDDDEVRVVVTEGKVRMENDTQSETTDAGGLYLEAGAVAVASGAGVLVEKRAPSAAEERLGWRNGVLIFRNDSLADAIAEFNRYNTRKIVIDDPSVRTLRIEGSFRPANIDAFARILEQVYSLHVTVDDERILVRR
jgi:transmembrane sensor